MTDTTIAQPRVSIIILCWNNRDLLEECLTSTYAQTYPNCHIILVDNGSTDGSIDYVKEHHPKVELIETGANLGFAVGNDIGIKRALEDSTCQYVALLNTDATIEPDWVERLVAFAQKHPKLASVQSPTVDYYDHTVLDSCGILIDHQALATQMGYRQTEVKLETRRVFGVNAAAAMISRAFLEVQPFGDDYLDHDLWMYLEDVDFATRAVMMGWENWFLNESRAYHMGSASSGKNPGFSLYMTYRNNALVLIKNLPWRIIIKTLPGLFRAELHRLRGFWRERKYPLIKAILKGRFQSMLRIPIFLRKRRVLKPYWRISEQELWELMRLTKLPKIPPKERPYGSESVAVIVLSHNNLGQLESCLKSVQSQTYPNIKTIVVDNNSTDGSLQYLEEKQPQLTLLAQTANLGIANGFNVGITKALQSGEPEHFVLLRADTTLQNDWMDVMVSTMRSHPKAFAVASKLLAQDGAQGSQVLNQGYDFRPIAAPRPITFKGSGVREILAADDHASIYRTEALGVTDILDGDFFEGLEDIDICFRAHLMGYRVYSQPQAVATTANTQALSESAQWYHAQKNLFFMYIKNFPLKLFLKYLPAGLIFTVRSYHRAIQKGFLTQQIKALAKGAYRIPRMLRQRRRINLHRRERAAVIDKVLRQSLGE